MEISLEQLSYLTKNSPAEYSKAVQEISKLIGQKNISLEDVQILLSELLLVN